MSQTIKTLVFVLATSLFLQACGVTIVGSETSDSPQNFVSFEIYEINRFGELEDIYSDCINLDQQRDEGSIYIETPYWGEDLTMHWRQDFSQISFVFEDHFEQIASSSFDRHYFLRGQTAEIALGTDLSDYLVRFTGPYCLTSSR
ncbi:MAG: hypothetical protein ACOH5I_18000 [Oligoflexus sp.]